MAKKPQGRFPSNTETNPRANVSAITLRILARPEINIKEPPKDNEESVETSSIRSIVDKGKSPVEPTNKPQISPSTPILKKLPSQYQESQIPYILAY